MTIEVKLPQWGMAMSEGTVSTWLVAEGDTVAAGQELVEIEAAKVTDTVTAPEAGMLGAPLVPEGETVPVNTVLVEILAVGDAGAGGAGPTSVSVSADAGDGLPSAGSVPRDAAAARAASGRVTGVVPLARKLAKEKGIDLRSITGTGTNGRIVVADVEAAIAGASTPAPVEAVQPSGSSVSAVSSGALSSAPVGTSSEPQPVASTDGAGTEKLSRMRKVIGERMSASLRDTAQLTLTTTADVTDFAQLRETIGGGARKPGYVDAVIRACALALRAHPGVNARIEGDTLVRDPNVNIGMAVALEDGLVVPVIRDADELGLAELGTRVRELAESARSGGLGPDAYSGGTFTVTSLGGQGIDSFTPILNPPESAILGIGRSREVPVRFGSGFAWRQEMTLSLTIDHRVIDGYPGALFLEEVVRLLERPRELL
ncbi:dihydrolipoamide acetyltransferase family protein [Gulosibacter chungangensis]|uniref:Dihydrolipoamide acetyltransferase component of pyruvate dehydrogenase complex n=1 Tax=Gulosibacter chungangensis TaxID=979746 RepID=A0A7J5BAH0_9MICO|nr:dihydrolipoamide acetyltransferase family protein [Gulosibacter chungangensis]KAB1642239.1 2-oxo acid dehydrogenase subunit E2 [Gulosibacter chungangensis]